jgi:hypothetical protein
MELKESPTSTTSQETFSATVEVMGEYFIKLAIIEFPWLNIPVVKQVFSFVVKKVLAKIRSEGELVISFAFIDKETEGRRVLYEEAVDKLKQVLESSPTQEKKDEALEETKKRLRALIRFPVE